MKGKEEDRMMRYRYIQTSENLNQNEALKLSRSDSSFSPLDATHFVVNQLRKLCC